jgi:hypothetical protein
MQQTLLFKVKMYKLYDQNGFSVHDLACAGMPDLFAFSFFVMQSGYSYMQKIDPHTAFQLIAQFDIQWFINNKFIKETENDSEEKAVQVYNYSEKVTYPAGNRRRGSDL